MLSNVCEFSLPSSDSLEKSFLSHIGRVLLVPTGLRWLGWLGFLRVLLGINRFRLV